MKNSGQLLPHVLQEPGAELQLIHSIGTETLRRVVRCLALDYDGTLSRIDISRNASSIPAEKIFTLQLIAKAIPIVIITTKDLAFVIPRTPFASAWSGVGGLETRIINGTHVRKGVEHKRKRVHEALQYAKSHLNSLGVDIEEKLDSRGHPLAFCVNWRQLEKTEAISKEIEKVAAYCQSLGLILVRSRQPFLDVYPQLPNKGRALKEILRKLRVNSGVLYIGDSQMDNTAFKSSDTSLGVVHGENSPDELACDHFVRFDDVGSFLKLLLANDFVFESDFSMIHKRKIKGKTATLRWIEKRNRSDA